MLLSKVSDTAKDSGLDIRLFKPQQEQKREFFAQVPVEVQVTGTYHQLATFFDEVGHLDRIVNLDNVHISKPEIDDDSVVKVQAEVMATAFRFLDESERKSLEEDEGGKKKKKGRRRKKRKKRG